MTIKIKLLVLGCLMIAGVALAYAHQAHKYVEQNIMDMEDQARQEFLMRDKLYNIGVVVGCQTMVTRGCVLWMDCARVSIDELYFKCTELPDTL